MTRAAVKIVSSGLRLSRYGRAAVAANRLGSPLKSIRRFGVRGYSRMFSKEFRVLRQKREGARRILGAGAVTWGSMSLASKAIRRDGQSRYGWNRRDRWR